MSYFINTPERYSENYKKSIKDPESFWEDIANNFIWKKKWDQVLEWDFSKPKVKWFEGAKLNITENCLDRHQEKNGDKTAFIWEPNDPQEGSIEISYKELYERVGRFSNVLIQNNIKKGDRVCLYLPMIPELVIAMLACARIGAIHSIVFAGFSSEALANRIQDAKAKLLITADGGFRGDKTIPLKDIADKALQSCDSIQKVIVVKRTKGNIVMQKERDIWWHEAQKGVSAFCEATVMDAEDPLFILYTSGSTGKPKGIVHSSGGYMVYTAYTFRNVFQCDPNDVYWCSADIGWITGHSYIVYGPLLEGATSVIFEGIPTFPQADRYWEIIEKNKVNAFYTSPTAIRSLMRYDMKYVEHHDLSSLKILGSVGEPINESAWEWYYKNIGKEKCFIVDTWWQTETGGIAISPLPHTTSTKPGLAMNPLPGIQPEIMDDHGHVMKGNNVKGQLCIRFPWPSILRTIYGDHQRCYDTYFSKFPGYYFTGDECIRDADGHYRIIGRVDDLVNISGHLLGTAEVENAIGTHPEVVESAVVSYPHEIKGNAISAFVMTYQKVVEPEKLKQELIELISDTIGKIAKPDQIHFVQALPKTRSGKIMRRILQKIQTGSDDIGDTSTLVNPNAIEDIIKQVKSNTIH